jgi:hypothetical protein
MRKTPKLKRCKACENILFPPPLQQVCGYNCAIKHNNNLKAKKAAAD